MSKRNLIDSLVVLMLIVLIAACTIWASSTVKPAAQTVAPITPHVEIRYDLPPA